MKAAVLEKLNAPLSVRNIKLPLAAGLLMDQTHIEYGQVLVRVLVAGICGAQLQEISGLKGDPDHLPHLLGHEGCGIVEGIGEGVKRVEPGDKVVLHWRKALGAANVSGSGGSGVSAGPLTCFSEYSIVSENRVTRVPDDLPNDLACLFGCSLSTALAVVENEARIKFGESVMIIGSGGVGLALILAAHLAHPFEIHAIDKSQDKMKMANDLGAIFFTEPWSHNSFDVIIDTTGDPHAIGQASLCLKDSGRMILVGQPLPEIPLMIPKFGHFFNGSGKTIKATQGGGFSPSTDIPRYVNLWKCGALRGWKKLISHRVSLDNINEGLELVRQGKAGRVLVDMQ